MPDVILTVIEQRAGKLNRMSLEALAAAQAIARDLGRKAEAIVPGHDIGGLAGEIPAEKVYQLDHPLLEPYTPDGYSLALKQAIEKLQPWLVLLPHTYQVRDFAPKLAASLGRGFVPDCIGYKVDNGELLLTRQLFQGKMNADVAFAGPAPFFASVQAGAFRADQLPSLTPSIEKIDACLEPAQIRTKPGEPFQEAKRTVDLTQAEVIVAVGRGIKEQENLAIVQCLCEVLNAELAASRPICDNGWLPMERQIGSSGQTVAPKLYVALGISGAIQHVVGMKNSRVIVAVNKDQHAPIFEVADYGIVGNLFDVVPPLVEEIKKAKRQWDTDKHG
jgi:electron transfer flavoprotein alpha subunit